MTTTTTTIKSGGAALAHVAGRSGRYALSAVVRPDHAHAAEAAAWREAWALDDEAQHCSVAERTWPELAARRGDAVDVSAYREVSRTYDRTSARRCLDRLAGRALSAGRCDRELGEIGAALCDDDSDAWQAALRRARRRQADLRLAQLGLATQADALATLIQGKRM
jgi:hypothetical protein